MFFPLYVDNMARCVYNVFGYRSNQVAESTEEKMKEYIIPNALQIVIDDLGWFNGKETEKTTAHHAQLCQEITSQRIISR